MTLYITTIWIRHHKMYIQRNVKDLEHDEMIFGWSCVIAFLGLILLVVGISSLNINDDVYFIVGASLGSVGGMLMGCGMFVVGLCSFTTH